MSDEAMEMVAQIARMTTTDEADGADLENDAAMDSLIGRARAILEQGNQPRWTWAGARDGEMMIGDVQAADWSEAEKIALSAAAELFNLEGDADDWESELDGFGLWEITR